MVLPSDGKRRFRRCLLCRHALGGQGGKNLFFPAVSGRQPYHKRMFLQTSPAHPVRRLCPHSFSFQRDKSVGIEYRTESSGKVSLPFSTRHRTQHTIYKAGKSGKSTFFCKAHLPRTPPNPVHGHIINRYTLIRRSVRINGFILSNFCFGICVDNIINLDFILHRPVHNPF